MSQSPPKITKKRVRKPVRKPAKPAKNKAPMAQANLPTYNGAGPPIRHTRFREHYLDKLFEMAAKGATYKQMAKGIGVHVLTLSNWYRDNPAVYGAIERGRQQAYYQVENALLRRATGFSVQENSREIHTNSRGEQIVTEKTSEKYIPPHVGAAIHWLTNCKHKAPDRIVDWVNQMAVKHTAEQTVQVDLENADEEQLKMLASFLKPSQESLAPLGGGDYSDDGNDDFNGS